MTSSRGTVTTFRLSDECTPWLANYNGYGVLGRQQVVRGCHLPRRNQSRETIPAPVPLLWLLGVGVDGATLAGGTQYRRFGLTDHAYHSRNASQAQHPERSNWQAELPNSAFHRPS
jgi:hypothetical protein